MAEVNGLKECKPAVDLEEQFGKCAEEVMELDEALHVYIANKTPKNRAEIAFEAMDVIVSATTLLNMIFNDEEINAAVDYTNAKNYVRGYYMD